MSQSFIRKRHVGSDPVSVKTSCASGNIGWLLALATVLALLLLGHGFADNLKYGIGSWEVPSGQPAQMWSQVDYHPELTDPFFKSNEWSFRGGLARKRTAILKALEAKTKDQLRIRLG